MYAIHRIDETLWQITLPNPSVSALPAARPINVYLFTGSAPALLNAGHPSQQRALAAALREIGVEPSRIERVVSTSWSIDVVGGIAGLPGADLFLLSPDMIQPTRHDDWQRGWREEWEAMLATLRANLGSLDRVQRVIKVLGMVNCTPGFPDHPKVINGCSELFAQVWGEENGVGARSAVGMGSLPGNIPTEIEAIFEID